VRVHAVYEKFADQLVAIAVYYGFDGWFLNIEVCCYQYVTA